MRLSPNQKELLEHIYEQGPITIEDGLEYYSAPSNFYRGVDSLADEGIIDRAAAPEASSHKYVYALTRKGRIIIE